MAGDKLERGNGDGAFMNQICQETPCHLSHDEASVRGGPLWLCRDDRGHRENRVLQDDATGFATDAETGRVGTR